ncbi:MAG: hypothetical protein ABI923_12935, partial [bacterium]
VLVSRLADEAAHLPDGSDLSKKLDHSTMIYMHPTERLGGSSNAISCSEEEARELLRIACQHCSEVVQKLQDCMRVAGVSYS